MKKIVMLFAAATMTVSVAFAQDINSVIEIYNNGINELSNEGGSKEVALEYFQTALTEAEILGDEGLQIASDCKINILSLMTSIANDYTKAQDYAAALEMLTKTKETADLYGETDKVAETANLINQVLMIQANDLLKVKDYAGAVGVYNQIMTESPDNAMAALRLGQCYAALNELDNAEAALLIAAANGQETQANKQLSTIYVKRAANALKEKNNQAAFDFAVKSNEYLENATAAKVAGQTAMALNKKAEGLAYLEKYVELSPNANDANQMRFNIAATAQQLGDKEKAKAYYQQVLNDPKFGPTAEKQLNALK